MSLCQRPLGLVVSAAVAASVPLVPAAHALTHRIDSISATASTDRPESFQSLWNDDQTMAADSAATGVSPRAAHKRSTRSRERRKRRMKWCKKYRDIVQNRVDFRTLPFVNEFWGYGLSLSELNDRFMALKSTDKHYLYQLWKRHRHHVRSAEFDRRKRDSHYRAYVGEIMDPPEILALGAQLTQVRNNMGKDQRARFRELLAVMLSVRRRVIVTYDERKNRRHSTRISRYHPNPSEMEGGCTDSRTLPLFTLEHYLSGRAPYVSIALDKLLYRRGKVRFGDEFRIPKLDRKYRDTLDKIGREYIVFRAVDTGSGFTGKRFTRLDLCVTTEGYVNRYRNGGKSIGRVELIQVRSQTRLGAIVDTPAPERSAPATE